MIESCPKKRMLLSITLLGIITVGVLILESHWTSHTKYSSRRNNFIIEQNSTCWEKESYKVIKDCEPCSAFELKSKHLGVCIQTKYKELLKCANGEIVSRSCDRAAYYDEQEFWRFEAWMLGLGLAFTVCVLSRKKVINKRMVQRVQRQLANSV